MRMKLANTPAPCNRSPAPQRLPPPPNARSKPMNEARKALRSTVRRLRLNSLALRKNWSARSFAQSLTDEEHALYRDYFPLFAHDYQLEPEGAWAIWLLMGGRGSGKTRAGAEWVMEQVALGAARHVALIGETLADARDVMIEGVSGIRRAAMDRDERPRFIKSERMLRWSNGAQARIFSAEDPDSVRGHAFDLVWGDEFAKWRYAQEVLDTTLFALRVGERPRMLITTTPRNRPDLRRLLNEPGLVVTRARTLDNADHLSAEFLTRIVKRYEGTALGRQELDGELLEDAQGALWNRAIIEAARVRAAPALSRIVVAVDPPVSSGP
ncbi:MAG TPA: hypothetical protein DCL54_18165, partial [Alphaproteobacteria bacterium]|nr:hypothetical protein [Alphaproteobacteria bacterium]